jgi:glutathione S-transferase
MKLYHQPRSRSTRVLWALEEIGAPFDLQVITREFKQTPEFRAVHPLGKSPAAVLDGGPMFESAAMVLQAADLHPEAGLIGSIGSYERALAYQWGFFAMTELEGPLMDVARQMWSDGDVHDDVVAAARARFEKAADAVTASLVDGYLIGGRFSVADLLVGGVLSFARTAELAPVPDGLAAYLDGLEARPARARAYAVTA